MISVDDAWALLANNLEPLGTETVSLRHAAGRVLAKDTVAGITHPPSAMSAMDGYAVAWNQPIETGQTFNVVGEAAAGTPFEGHVGSNAVRVFTGSVVPRGAEHIIIQEDVQRTGPSITVSFDQTGPRHIRPAGNDFTSGEVLVEAASLLTPARVALLAAAGVSEVTVRRRPTVAIFANGDELVEPGSSLAAGQVYNSVPFGLAPLIEGWGASVCFIGTATDQVSSVNALFDDAADADLVVPVGGASVGDYDVVKQSARERFDLIFEKIAVKPGKPTWFGTKDSRAVLGLPGNPASAFVCAHLFVKSVIDQLLDRSAQRTVTAKLCVDVAANGAREQFIRASVGLSADGQLLCEPLARQDSSLLSTLSQSQGLLRRKAKAPAARAGAAVDLVLLKHGIV